MTRRNIHDLVRELRANRDVNPPTLADTRANFDRLTSRFPVAPDINVADINLGGVKAEHLSISGCRTQRYLLYFHGGGYIIGSPRTHRALAGNLARAARAQAIVPDYRRAPEHPHPAPVEDGLRAYESLLEIARAPNDIIVAGDSAGGGLTIALLTMARDRGLPLPAAAACLSPWIDLEATGASVKTCADSDPIVAPNHIHAFARMFIGNGNLQDPTAAPLHADLAGLPPLLIQVGDNETLLDDAVRLAGRATEAGVETTLRIWPDMFHVWHLYARELPEGQAAIEEIGRFIRRL